ncbi:MAG: OmpA family protein [Gammaproteobacteria bacterium]
MNRLCRVGMMGAGSAVLLMMWSCGKSPAPQTEMAAPPAPPTAAETPAPPNPEEQLKTALNELGVTQTGHGSVLALSSARFKPGQTQFEPEDTSRIDRVAELMKSRPDLHVRVQSFTDSRGGAAHNKKISQQRADAVQHALIERGVAAERIASEGRGETQPIASNDTASGREQNRRVEILFSDAQGRFAAATDSPPIG